MALRNVIDKLTRLTTYIQRMGQSYTEREIRSGGCLTKILEADQLCPSGRMIDDVLRNVSVLLPSTIDNALEVALTYLTRLVPDPSKPNATVQHITDDINFILTQLDVARTVQAGNHAFEYDMEPEAEARRRLFGHGERMGGLLAELKRVSEEA